MRKSILFLIVFIPIQAFTQIDSSRKSISKKDHLGKYFLVPSSILFSGLLARQTKLDKVFRDEVKSAGLSTNTRIDDYLRFAPVVELYIADFSYSKTNDEIFQQTKNLFFAQLLSSLIVETVKRSTNTNRPNGREHSFPSGHSSIAFTGASALYIEFKEKNKLVAYSGYGISAATGILRITNDEHWLSDVLVGAGIGIASAQLIWYLNPLKKWNPFKKKDIVFYSYVDGLSERAGVCLMF